MQKKVSFLSVILFVISAPYLTYTYFYIPTLIKNNGNTAYLFPIILGFISCLMIILLPKKFFQIDYLSLLRKSYFAKASLGVFLILMIIINLFIFIRIVAELFFYQHHYIIFAIAIITVCLILSRNKTDVLINASTCLLLGGYLLGLLPMFISGDIKDYTFLQPLEFSFSSRSLIFGLIYIFDIFLYCIFSSTPKKLKKKHLILTSSLLFSSLALQALNIILLTGVDYFVDNEFLGYFNFFIQDAVTYVGNLGFIYLYLISIIGFFKISFDFSLFNKLFNIKRTIIGDMIYSLLLLLIIIFMYKSQIFNLLEIMFFVGGVFFVVVIIFIMINRSDKYEIIF